MNDKLVSIGKAAKHLGVHPDTLRNWEEKGKIKPIRTFGKHRRYRLSELEAAMQQGGDK
jgi:excisionase family DNA binding protein